MKIQKIILCAAIALTAFGASLGLLEIVSYLRTAFEPAIKVEIKPLEPIRSPVFHPPRIPDSPAPALTPVEESEPEEMPEHDWNGTGDYYIVGDNPKGFEDFTAMFIVTREWDANYKNVVPVTPSGSIHTKREFKFSRLEMTGQRISAATETIRGVSYRFVGKFVKEKSGTRTYDGFEFETYTYLKGRLTKWLGGKKIADAKVKFEIGGC